MSNMMKRVALVAVAAAFVAQATWAADDAGSMIGADYYAAAVVKSPEKAIASMDAFIKAAKLDRYFPEGSGSLLDALAKSGGEFETILKEIDRKRPLVLVAVPAPGKTMAAQVWLPVLRGKASVDAMIPDSADDVKYSIVGSYAVLVSAGEAPKLLPAKKADAPWLAVLPDDAVGIWVNWEKGRADFGDEFFEQFSRIGKSQGDDTHWYDEKGWFPNSGMGDSSEAEILAALKELAVEIRGFGVTLQANAEGVSARVSCATNATGTLHDLSAAFATLKPGIPFVKYLEAGKLMTMAANFPPETYKIVQKLYERMFSSLGEGFVAYMNKAAEMNAFIGSNSAMALDVGIDPKLMSEASNAQTAKDRRAVLEKYVQVGLSSVFELKDTAGYRKRFGPWIEEILGSELIAGILSQAGIVLDPAVSAETVDGLPVDSIRINFSMKPEQVESMGENDRATMTELFDWLNELLTIRYAYRDGKAYGGLMTAKDGVALAKRDAAAKRLDAGRGYAAFSKVMPSDSRLIGTISFARVADLVAAFNPTLLSSVDRASLGDGYFHMGVSRDAFTGGWWVSSADVAAFGSIIGPLIMQGQ